MFNTIEKQHLLDALEMAVKSNQRMQHSKPQFSEIFNRIATELQNLKHKITNIEPIRTPKS